MWAVALPLSTFSLDVLVKRVVWFNLLKCGRCNMWACVCVCLEVRVGGGGANMCARCELYIWQRRGKFTSLTSLVQHARANRYNLHWTEQGHHLYIDAALSLILGLFLPTLWHNKFDERAIWHSSNLVVCMGSLPPTGKASTLLFWKIWLDKSLTDIFLATNEQNWVCCVIVVTKKWRRRVLDQRRRGQILLILAQMLGNWS